MQKIEEGLKQIVKLQYAFVKDITSMDENPDKTLNVVFAIGSWIDFYSKLYSINFSETADNSNSGVIYKQKLAFDLQGDKNNINEEFYKIVNRELIFRLIYEDGTSKILGENNNPCFIFKDFNSIPLDTVHNFYIIKEDYRPSLYLNS